MGIILTHLVSHGSLLSQVEKTRNRFNWLSRIIISLCLGVSSAVHAGTEDGSESRDTPRPSQEATILQASSTAVSSPSGSDTSSDSATGTLADRLAPKSDSSSSVPYDILNFLAEATHEEPHKIYQDLIHWAQQLWPKLPVFVFHQYLRAYYTNIEKHPYPRWDVEFNHFQVTTQAEFLLDEIGVLELSHPALVDRRHALWSIVPNTGIRWSGSYKTVYPVILPEGDFACTQIFKDFPPGLNATQRGRYRENYFEALHEVKVLAQLKTALEEERPKKPGAHKVPGILSVDKFFGVSEITGRILFIAPLCNRGSADTRLPDGNGDPGVPIQPSDLDLITEDLLTGLEFLHSHGFVHRDIKPGNILLDRPEEGGRLFAYLNDFGTAYQKDDPDLTEQLRQESNIRTTYPYAAPEAIEKFLLKKASTEVSMSTQAKWELLKPILKISSREPLRWDPTWPEWATDQASDVWSLGVSLLQLVTLDAAVFARWFSPILPDGTNPRSALSSKQFVGVNQAVIDQIFESKSYPRLQSSDAIPVVATLKCMLRVHPAERCTAARALELFHSLKEARQPDHEVAHAS